MSLYTVIEKATGEQVRVCYSLEDAKLALKQCEAYDLYFDIFSPDSYFIIKK